MNYNNFELYNIVNEDDIVKLYHFGSKVYGSDDSNSDDDFIIIVKNYPEFGSNYKSNNLDIEFFTEPEWEVMVKNYDVRAMECICQEGKVKIKDKNQFRKSFSTIYSGAWVKGCKKLTTSDYEPDLAIKSIFHSLRILDFGIQIMQNGTIVDYSKVNWILDDLRNLKSKYHRTELWEKIQDKYLARFKEQKAIFNKLAPKKTRKSQIAQVLNKHKIKITKQLLKDLTNV